MIKDLNFMPAVMMILDRGGMYREGSGNTKFYFDSSGSFQCWHKGRYSHVELLECDFRGNNWVVDEDWVPSEHG